MTIVKLKSWFFNFYSSCLGYAAPNDKPTTEKSDVSKIESLSPTTPITLENNQRKDNDCQDKTTDSEINLL